MFLLFRKRWSVLAKELNAIARKVLRFYYDRGIKIILTDLDTILKNL